MSDATPVDKQLLHLVQAYCNGTITKEEFGELERRLEQDASARVYYRRFLNLHASLADHGLTAGKDRNLGEVADDRRRSFRTSAVFIIAATMLVALGVLWWTFPQPRQMPAEVAALEQSNGHVQITSASGNVRDIDNGRTIHSGDTIRTHGALSSALLAFADGTRLSLAGNTAMTFSETAKQKSVTVHGGTLFASVIRQPTGIPLLVLTPQNKVEVLGTKFSLKATENETEVAVSEGQIRLTRLNDGQSVEVKAGQQAISNPQALTVLAERSKLAEEWGEDFDDGLPEGWGAGKFVTTDLPMGSRGAVQAARSIQSDGIVYSIITGSAWANGLFAIGDNTHLHCTFRMQTPRWFNVLLSTRTTDGDPPAFASNYIFDKVPWHTVKPGKWYTLSIPLTKFKRLSPGKQAFVGEVPFQIIFSSEEPDRGLVIDRMWVTRDGRGKVIINPR